MSSDIVLFHKMERAGGKEEGLAIMEVMKFHLPAFWEYQMKRTSSPEGKSSFKIKTNSKP